MEVKEFLGTPEEFTAWVKENIMGIAKQCGWTEISAVTEKPMALRNQERTVLNLTIMHTDGVKTYLMCEVANDGLPFSACLESFIAMKAIQTGERLDGCVVVVSPSIDERIVGDVHRKNVPINFLMANPTRYKYWSYAKELHKMHKK
jgi:hypothetical protein